LGRHPASTENEEENLPILNLRRYLVVISAEIPSKQDAASSNLVSCSSLPFFGFWPKTLF